MIPRFSWILVYNGVGYGPSGIAGLVVVILILLLLTGRL
ncbi:DUF3309 family protein [Janthinobacterium sp. CG_23.4]